MPKGISTGALVMRIQQPAENKQQKHNQQKHFFPALPKTSLMQPTTAQAEEHRKESREKKLQHETPKFSYNFKFRELLRKHQEIISKKIATIGVKNSKH